MFSRTIEVHRLLVLRGQDFLNSGLNDKQIKHAKTTTQKFKVDAPAEGQPINTWYETVLPYNKDEQKFSQNKKKTAAQPKTTNWFAVGKTAATGTYDAYATYQGILLWYRYMF